MHNLHYIFPHTLQTWCQVVGGFAAYAFSASSIWLYFEALYVHYAVTSGRLKGRAFTCYMPLGWGLPILHAGGIAAIRAASLGEGWRCWPSYEDHTAYALLAPILVFNIVHALSLIIDNDFLG